MPNINEKIISHLSKTYGFIVDDKTKFDAIVLKGIPEDIEYTAGIIKGKKNIVKYVVKELKDTKFSELFDKSVDKIGIDKAFNIYDIIISAAKIDIEPAEIMTIALNEKYKEYYDGIKTTRNVLLLDVLGAYRPEEVEIDDTPEIYTGRVTDQHEDDYLRSIRNISFLNREQEIALFKKYKETHDEDDKEEFISHYLRLSASIAKRYKCQTEDLKLGLMDLIQEGNLGLLDAFDRWNEDLGYRFTTYSKWWIDQRIRRAIKNENSTIRIPVHMGEIIDKKNAFIRDYRNTYGKEPTNEEIMKYLNASRERYRDILKAESAKRPTSLDQAIESEDTMSSRQKSIQEFIEDESINVENETMDAYNRDELLRYLDKYLTPREKQIVLYKNGFNKFNREMTLEEIGKILGVTRERVRQLLAKAMDKLQMHRAEIKTPEHNDHGQVLSRMDLIRRLEEKDMNIRVAQFKTQKNNSLFECLDCGNKFNEMPEDLLKRGYCPFCGEKEKELIKK